MSDVSVPYVLTTPGPDITFNDDSADQFYITEITGLGGVDLRTPIDPVPFGDGGIVHDFWEGPRHVVVEGVFLITSTITQSDILVIRNTMEENLRSALSEIKRADGTLAWTPAGQGARSLTVRNDIRLDCRHVENYLLRAFTFGLVAGDPDW